METAVGGKERGGKSFPLMQAPLRQVKVSSLKTLSEDVQRAVLNLSSKFFPFSVDSFSESD